MVAIRDIGGGPVVDQNQHADHAEHANGQTSSTALDSKAMNEVLTDGSDAYGDVHSSAANASSYVDVQTTGNDPHLRLEVPLSELANIPPEQWVGDFFPPSDYDLTASETIVLQLTDTQIDEVDSLDAATDRHQNTTTTNQEALTITGTRQDDGSIDWSTALSNSSHSSTVTDWNYKGDETSDYASSYAAFDWAAASEGSVPVMHEDGTFSEANLLQQSGGGFDLQVVNLESLNDGTAFDAVYANEYAYLGSDSRNSLLVPGEGDSGTLVTDHRTADRGYSSASSSETFYDAAGNGLGNDSSSTNVWNNNRAEMAWSAFGTDETGTYHLDTEFGIAETNDSWMLHDKQQYIADGDGNWPQTQGTVGASHSNLVGTESGIDLQRTDTAGNTTNQGRYEATREANTHEALTGVDAGGNVFNSFSDSSVLGSEQVNYWAAEANDGSFWKAAVGGNAQANNRQDTISIDGADGSNYTQSTGTAGLTLDTYDISLAAAGISETGLIDPQFGGDFSHQDTWTAGSGNRATDADGNVLLDEASTDSWSNAWDNSFAVIMAQLALDQQQLG